MIGDRFKWRRRGERSHEQQTRQQFAAVCFIKQMLVDLGYENVRVDLNMVYKNSNSYEVRADGHGVGFIWIDRKGGLAGWAG